MSSRHFVSLLLLLSLVIYSSGAQVVPLISKVQIPSATENRALSISVDLTSSSGVQRVVFAYRQFGEGEYTEREMLLAGRSASITLPADVVKPPYVEYFIRIEGDREETYPLQNAMANPEKIAVAQLNPKDLEVRVLSPEPGETVSVEELAIMVSLFYTSDEVNRRATRLFLDGVEVSRDAILSEDVILYSPRNFDRPLALGTHVIRVELRDTAGRVYHTIERSFSLSTAAAIAEQKSQLQLATTGQLEYRNEDVSGAATTYARGDIRTNGAYSFLNFGANIHLDNQDKPGRQPQNRYLITGETSFLRLQYGDAYPRFPSLIMSGKRIRGLTANLALGFFNVDVSFGETKRLIEGILTDSILSYRITDTSAIHSRPKNTTFKSRTDTTELYSVFHKGTYRQNIIAVRPSFGSGENFQLGFTYMKAKDNVGSIKYGILPSENLVVGTDLMFAFDDQKFKFETQASLAMENKDISGGNFTPAEYDSVFKDNAAGKSAAKFAEKLITVNENLFPTNPAGSGLPGISLEAQLTLNYLNNFVQAQFFRRGASYKSYGNEFVQTDIQGFQVSDRVRLLSNRVLLSVSYEQKSDNTADTKRATTTFSNLNTSVNINPGVGWPSFSVGYGLNSRLSDLDVRKLEVGVPDSTSTTKRKSADDATTRLFFGSSYDFLVAGNRNTATLTLNTSSRTDQTFFQRDQKNFSLQTGVTTNFNFPLQTTVSIGINQNENFNMLFNAQGKDSIKASTKFNFTTISLGAQYRLLGDALRLTANLSPTSGDISRTMLLVGADYEVRRNHNVEFSLGYINNKGAATDIITSLIYRFSF